MRWLKRIALTAVALVFVAGAGLGAWALLPARTPALEGVESVSALERVELGGFEQTILVRGQDRRNPVLLYLHGGPGAAMLPLAGYYSDVIEREFVVVHWDQRGAGASCEGVDWDTVTLERIVDDTLELSERLAERFGGGGKIFLLGHSWGSVVGTLAVARRPELFHAYVGMGQVVNGLRNEELSLKWVREEARRRGDSDAIAELAHIWPPYETEELLLQRGWLNRYNGSIYATDRAWPALLPALFGREYTVATRHRWPGCLNASLEAMWREVAAADFPKTMPRLEIPVFFFAGRHDWNTPFPLVEEWAATLSAPRVEVVWFDDAGHMIPVESPVEFQRALIDRVLPLADSSRRSMR